jgi:hypothetical protein
LSWLLFIDESCHDGKHCPYEVLAGMAVEDCQLWSLINRIQEAEIKYFGQRISDSTLELKAKRLLKRKTFRLAHQMATFDDENARAILAKSCLAKGQDPDRPNPTREELTALAQAKLAFVSHLFTLCAQHGAKAFASIVASQTERPKGSGFLRKDYVYLFERYYNFLETCPDSPYGLIVFDELEKSQCHILIDQMAQYFTHTENGRMRSGRIIPEPFFVHSHLTTAIQLADILAYTLAWGFRLPKMSGDKREELQPYIHQVEQLRFFTQKQDQDGRTFPLWGFTYIKDLVLIRK